MPPKPSEILQDLKAKLPRPLERQPDPTGRRSLSVSRRIPAPAPRIFAVLVNPRNQVDLDGSKSMISLLPSLPTRLGPGVQFGAEIRRRIPYRVTFTVVEFEESRRIAWAHAAGQRWRFRLDPGEDGTTQVTETFDWSTALVPMVVERLSPPERVRAELEASLAGLEQLVLSERTPAGGR